VIYEPSGIGVEPVVLVRRGPAGCGGSKQFDGRGSAVKLEAGKRYVLNNDEVVGPISEFDGTYDYPFHWTLADGRRRTWTANGAFLYGRPGHPLSIAQEFVPAMPAIEEAAESAADREQGELQLIRNAFNTHFPEWNLFNDGKSDVMAMVAQIASLKRNIVAMDEHLQKCEEERKQVSKDACIEIVEKIARVIVDTAEQWKRDQAKQ